MNEYNDIIIAVHGIGEQRRNATVRSVATRFARSANLRDPRLSPPSPQPLGYFHSDSGDAVKVVPIGNLGVPDHVMSKIGFAEVFWADIPDRVVTEKRTLEETKAWARTVVSRARAAYKKGNNGAASRKGKNRIREPDFGQIGETLDQIIDTVQVLENLCFLLEKAGVVKFELRKVLEAYIGDVQLVTEFTQYRREIIGRFHRALDQIYDANKKARIYIVAHSEGSVVSFLGLLHAMSGEDFAKKAEDKATVNGQNGAAPRWLKSVYGFMTIGSPIDKHLILWPQLFEGFKLSSSKEYFDARKAELEEKQPKEDRSHLIEWRNYYDHGDPVGFELDSTRSWLNDQSFNPFHFIQEFEDDKGRNKRKPPPISHDIGFSRYILPGKAHNDYWEDAEVFEHFICDVIRPELKKKIEKFKAPGNRSRAIIGPIVPYLLSFLILFAGVFVIYKALSNFVAPPLDTVQNYIRYSLFGTLPPEEGPSWHLPLNTSVLTLLVAGTTLMSRFLRLKRTMLWFGIGMGCFAVGAAFYVSFITTGAADAVGGFAKAVPDVIGPKWAAVILAGAVGGVGFLSIPKAGFLRRCKERIKSRPPSSKDEKDEKQPSPATPEKPEHTRRTRYFRRGMRPLIFAGAIALTIVIIGAARKQDKSLSSLTEPEQSAALTNYSAKGATAVDLANTVPTAAAKAQLDITKRIVKDHRPLWPVILSSLVFLYVWWLAALVFDLALVWHKYIRDTRALKAFAEACSLPKTVESLTPTPKAPANAGSEISNA